ncbi:enediyne antibiotic chromoprotein [Amycolatopsis sp. lyj-84]|uniref:enediyne antibiotic chromoprotein n=1 Tax=Amycolatopsis sp. lyj-84 TaxID=2789284 RepID=UPI0039788E26
MSAKLVAKFAGSAIAALGLLAVVAPGASAAAAVTVTPASGLSDGAVVQVTGTGLTPGGTYRVGECAQDATGQFPCSPSQLSLVADASGKISSPVTVQKNFTGVLPDGSSYGAVDCKVITCVVGLGDAAGNGGGVIISFS